VILVAVTDPRGKNPKPRPAVILTHTEELSRAEEFVVAAISTTFSEPLPPDYVELPWAEDGRAMTGLRQPSVVKCRWLKRVRRDEILRVAGHIPPRLMLKIMQLVTKN